MIVISTFDRRSEIIQHVNEQQRVSTRALSQRFDVSEVTIRHDLRVLAEQGWLQRVHGGAEITPDFQPERPFATRQHLHPSEKESIAVNAATLIRRGDTILLDSSTTAFYLAQALMERPLDLQVVTNNLHAAVALKDARHLEVIILGGSIRGDTSSIVGALAADMLAGIHVDKGFFSASGLTVERGLTDADTREVEIKRAMVKSCKERVIMLDVSKFGQQSFGSLGFRVVLIFSTLYLGAGTTSH